MDKDLSKEIYCKIFLVYNTEDCIIDFNENIFKNLFAIYFRNCKM